MEPITTGLIINFILSLAKKGVDKAFETTGEKVSEGAIGWVKSLFYTKNKPRKVLQDVQDNPNDVDKIKIAAAVVENSVEGNPEYRGFLLEIIQKINNSQNIISSSRNVNTGNVDTHGGNFRIGDDYGK